MSNLLKSKFFLGALVAVFALVGFSKAQAYTHTVTLKMGANNAQVMELQKTLNMTACKVAASGVGSMGMESSYFGGLTSAAVKCFQAANGLTADGVVGPMTGAKLAMVTGSTGGTTTGGTAGCPAGAMYNYMTGDPCTGNTGGNTGNTGGLTGGAGDITVNGLSTYSSEEVGEGEEDVKVMAFEIEADDESDVEINSVKLEFFQGTGADSEDLTDYADSVSVWMGSDKVGEADAEDFNENSNVYSKSVSLDGAVVKAGDTEKFYVAVTALSNLDSGDIDTDAWYGGVSAVRFTDGDGVVTTESLTLDVDEETVDDEVEQTFDFTDFATATDVELNVSTNDSDDEINIAHVIDVDDSDDTNDVAILSFVLENKGDSDINVTGAANVDDMITNITLWHGDEEIDSSSVGSGVGADETYTFDDIDVDVAAGDEEEFMVKVDFKSTGDVDLDNGDTISAQLSGTEVDAIEAEDETGEDVGTGDLTGTAVGEASAVYDSGIMVTFTSATETTTFSGDAAGEEDIAQYKINFKVESFDGDMRIDNSCEEAGADAAGQGIEYTVTGDDNDAPACTLTSSSTDSEDTANTFEIDEGATPRSFTLSVSITGDDDASGDFISVALSSINWGTATDNTNANYYTFNLDEFKTDTLFVNSQ